MSNGDVPPGERPSAVRLIFSFDGDDVTLVSRQPVEMTVPAVHPTGEEEEGQTAPAEFAAELRGAEDQILYRARMANPLAPHREVFSEGEERTIHRVPVEHPSGAFTVVVPDHPEGEYVALMSAAPPGAEGGVETLAIPREIGRFPLRAEKGEGAGSS